MAGDRGYLPYNPSDETAHWLRCAQKVVADYRANWPLTVRQVFYRMVATYDFPKKEEDYKRLVKIVARARRASLVQPENGIDFRAIRDDRGQTREPWEFGSEKEYIDYLIRLSDSFTLHRQDGQEQVLEMWCEAAGMVPIMVDIAHPYGMRVSSGGGYDSVTAKHKLATRVVERWRNEKRGTIVLHVGDFDPSGENLCDVLHEDVLMMVAQRLYDAGTDTHQPYKDAFAVERVALTGQQVIDREVITAPPKPTDARMAGFIRRNEWVADALGTDNITAQLEALTPDELRELIEDAIRSHLDMNEYRARLDEEDEIRDNLRERLETV